MFRAAFTSAMLACVHASAWLFAVAILALVVIVYAAILGLGVLALSWVANTVASLITTCAC